MIWLFVEDFLVEGQRDFLAGLLSGLIGTTSAELLCAAALGSSMPCYFPLEATCAPRGDGKQKVTFASRTWRRSDWKPDGYTMIPCGRCIGCRLERSRQWALRCVHEAKMHDESCFVTLTYADEYLPEGGTLVRKDVQLFMKRLRQKKGKVRVFYAGEYGEDLQRPHYHLCLFGCAFDDAVFWKKVLDSAYYVSDELCALWPFGHSVIGDLTFESAAYVARYCTKKITGDLAKDHYGGRLPEFAGMSLKPGIGATWLEKYGKTDVFPHDECIARGHPCKVPRYYDVLWERLDPKGFAVAKARRKELGEAKASDATPERMAVRLKCQEARMRLLSRTLEKKRI